MGQPFDVQLVAGAYPSGVALLAAGLDGTDASGCGLLVPGLGELLLALAPVPRTLADAPTVGGIADFALVVPALPTLVGQTAVLQGANVALPGGEIELSSGLALTFTE